MLGLLLCLIVPARASAADRKVHHPVRRTVHRRHNLIRRHRAFVRHHPMYRAKSRRSSIRRTIRRRVWHRPRGWHMPALHIAPKRAEQIQEALIRAGELHEQPTGVWDAQTRNAMKLYQQANGFDQTGLPDAKSLMKMGLGPHPLPAELDPVAQAQNGFASAGSQPDPSGLPPDN